MAKYRSRETSEEAASVMQVRDDGGLGQGGCGTGSEEWTDSGYISK